MNHAHKRTSGFTLIELMLSMSFLSVLLLAIAMTIIQIGTIYNKGIVVKDLTQASRTISEEVSRTANEANQLNLATDLRETTAGGRLCFGNYTYIWNTALAIERSDPAITRAQSSTTLPHLMKVPDIGKIYCSINSSGALAYRDIRAVDTPLSQELLPEGDNRVGVQKFTILPSSVVTDTTTQQVLYTLLFTLGSGDTKAMNSDQSQCLPPGSPEADPIYCTVQPFSIVLRTGSKG